MCGGFGLFHKDLSKYLSKLRVTNTLDWSPRYNIRPHQFSPVITEERKVELARFGLLPSWAKDPKIANMMINARSETVDKKPSYAKPLRESRVGVLADGYFEWAVTKNGKQPYFFRLKSHEPFMFAGVSDFNDKAEEKPVMTYSIITTDAPGDLAKIHDRVPVILKPSTENIWLDPDIIEPDKLKGLLQPISPDLLDWYPVSTLVNRFVNDSEEVIKPLN